MSPNKSLILYGSETGTAQDVAESIWRDFKRLGFDANVLGMDDYEISNLISEPLIIFVCSTTGQGDPPSNMKKFWKFVLRKSLPSSSLSNSHVAVLGLGDSSYPKYNFAAKRLFKRLLALGARPLVNIGLCDDQHELGIYAELNPWLETLWNTLNVHNPRLKEESMSTEKTSLFLRWRAITVQDIVDEIKFHPGEPNEQLICTVSSNKRVTPQDHFQEVRVITFKPNQKNIYYSPGAVACFRPWNLPSSVEQFFSLFKDQLPHNFTLEPVFLPLPDVLKGKVLSLQDVANVFWDLQAVPRRRVFEILAAVTTSDLEREKLEEFLSPGGLDELYSYCNRPHRTTLEVLQDFPYALERLTLDHLFEIFQQIRPREYSISSSIEYDGPVIQILVAVVKYKTRLSTPRLGLASNWLASLSGEVVLSLKPGTLRFPERSPVIMVGPGTGVAPFRSYISHSIAKTFGKGDEEKQKMVLFFGARYQERDFYFKDDFLKWHTSGDLTLVTAFSRDQPNKIYVQHKIIDEGEKIFLTLYKMEGYVFVAGSSKDMPSAVKNAFIDVVSQFSNLSTKETEVYFEKMNSCGRYQEETWS